MNRTKLDSHRECSWVRTKLKKQSTNLILWPMITSNGKSGLESIAYGWAMIEMSPNASLECK